MVSPYQRIFLPSIVSIRFQILFHSPPGVLFTTVLFAIGHWVVFRLGGWALRLHTGLHVSGTTLVSPSSLPISSTGISPSASGLSRTLRLSSVIHIGDPQPLPASRKVWPLSRSLAATRKIDVSFSS